MTHRLQSASIIAGVVLLDRLTKIYIRTHVSPWDVIPVIPGFFNIVHTENPAAAFGVFANLSPEWRRLLLIGVSAAVAVIVGYLLFRAPRSGETNMMRIGFVLVVGGALGNLWDRLFRGTVTDFLQLFFGSYEFPSFNVADSAITIGAALLLIDLWRSGRKSPARHDGGSSGVLEKGTDRS
ncbi:MAG TPA: signal peptidase II [Bryobacteraceae bacterium]|nr:signal peptidase II [Bryobacteraceae bacterium]